MTMMMMMMMMMKMMIDDVNEDVQGMNGNYDWPSIPLLLCICLFDVDDDDDTKYVIIYDMWDGGTDGHNGL